MNVFLTKAHLYIYENSLNVRYTFICVSINLPLYSKWLILVSLTSKYFLGGDMRFKTLVAVLVFLNHFISKE